MFLTNVLGYKFDNVPALPISKFDTGLLTRLIRICLILTLWPNICSAQYGVLLEEPWH